MANNKGGNTVQKAYEIAKPAADELGLSLWDVAFEKEGAYWYLKVLIDKPGDSISMDDCEALSRILSKKLDEKDPIDQSYILEVGSPGLGRQLKRKEHFEEYLECPVRIRYIRETDGQKELIAIIKSFNGDTISVLTEEGEKDIVLAETAFIKLYDDEDLFDEDDE